MGNDVNPEDIKIAQAMMAGQIEKYDENGNVILSNKELNNGQPIKKDEIYKYQQIQQMANSQVAQAQAYASQCKNNYDNNVSIWQTAAEEELEAQEQWEMDLLAEEQADMEAEKTSIEMQLKRVQEEKQNIEQALDASIKDSAPKFGVG
jgi:hypothetical protein